MEVAFTGVVIGGCSWQIWVGGPCETDHITSHRKQRRRAFRGNGRGALEEEPAREGNRDRGKLDVLGDVSTGMSATASTYFSVLVKRNMDSL